MDRCNAKVSSAPIIKMASTPGSTETKKLHEDAASSCDRYGAYTVRRAAIQQISDDNANALAGVGLAAYTKFDDLIDISNKAFDSMTPKEKHRELCANLKMEFWWPIGTGPINDL